MPLSYKIDVLQALKDNGYNTNRLRKEKILAESTIQKLRDCKPISWANIAQLCELLSCQPSDILIYTEDEADFVRLCGGEKPIGIIKNSEEA